MSFILVSKRGDLQVNAWNWRPTLELLMAENVVTREQYERLGAQGCGGRVDADTANHIADAIERRLVSTAMQPSERMLADLTITSDRRPPTVFLPNGESEWYDDIYSASYDWLVTLRDFCRQSGGFEVY